MVDGVGSVLIFYWPFKRVFRLQRGHVRSPMRQNVVDTNSNPSIAEERIIDTAIEEQAYHTVDMQQHFLRRANRFVFECEDGVLSVSGCVPSFYLKQVLQNTLRFVPGVRAVENRVTVISGHGMSSVSAG